jgi:hypothetical protein
LPELLGVAGVVLGLNMSGLRVIGCLDAVLFSERTGLITLKLLIESDHTFGVAETLSEDVEASFLESEESDILAESFTLLGLVGSFSFNLHLSNVKLLMPLLVVLVVLNLMHLLGNVSSKVFLLGQLPLIAVFLDSAKGVKALIFGQITVLAECVNAHNVLYLAMLEGLGLDKGPLLRLLLEGFTIGFSLVF